MMGASSQIHNYGSKSPKVKSDNQSDQQKAAHVRLGEDMTNKNAKTYELPIGVKVIILAFVAEMQTLKSEAELANAAIKFVRKHLRELAPLIGLVASGLAAAVIVSLFPPGLITLSLATLLIWAVSMTSPARRSTERATALS
jgi:hypothetical protein